MVTKWNVSMKHRWKDNDRGRQKYSERNKPQCHFAHHNSILSTVGSTQFTGQYYVYIPFVSHIWTSVILFMVYLATRTCRLLCRHLCPTETIVSIIKLFVFITRRPNLIRYRCECFKFYTAVDCARMFLEHVWNVMAHAQKPDLFFQRNGRVHLNWTGRGGGVSSVDYWQPNCAHQR